MPKKNLIIAAYPDDEIIGCGGTAARLIKEGQEVFTLILGEGITARDKKRSREKRKDEINLLKQQVIDANKVIGVKDVFVYAFPDNRFDSVPLLDVVKTIEEVYQQVGPDVVFTHFKDDLNIDHRITFQAVLTAFRPMAGQTVKEIYSFEVLSSTEWGFPLTFSPDCFFDISDTITFKAKAMEKYKSELGEYPHPRSIKGIYLNAENWGMKTGMAYAEAFKTVRILR
ncbi:PIG-L deacetylase family protein [Acidobacteriota bacterium]